MTYLIAPISGIDSDEVRTLAHTAIDAGADAIELRLDLTGPYTGDDLRTLRQTLPTEVPLILTIRSAAEGGAWDGGDDDRVSRLIELGPFVDYIDIELALWLRSANIRQKIGLALRRGGHVSHDSGREEITDAAPRRLILSRHDHTGRPATLSADLLAMCREPLCDVAKLAWRARTVRDNLEAFELMRESPRPILAICMGKHGAASRVLSKKFGAFGAFGAVAAGRETAAGQLTIDEMRSRYRWDAIKSDTAVYGLVGEPIAHSLSPALHNAGFEAARVNAVYLPFEVSRGYEPFKAFMVEVLARPWLDFRGLSITIPHKENALRFIREAGGVVDDSSLRIGAVNTLCIQSDGRLVGHNTDAPAAMDCICKVLRCEPTDLKAKRVAVLGAGGVARAVIAVLTAYSPDVTVYNRTSEKAVALAKEFGCQKLTWDARDKIGADLLINCTSIGLWPDVSESPMAASALQPSMAVFDTVYRPFRTRLLQDALEKGCPTMDGLTMFLHQAQAQFRLWTGKVPPADVFSETALGTIISMSSPSG